MSVHFTFAEDMIKSKKNLFGEDEIDNTRNQSHNQEIVETMDENDPYFVGKIRSILT